MFLKLLFSLCFLAKLSEISGTFSDTVTQLNNQLLSTETEKNLEKSVAWSPYSLMHGLVMLYEGMGDSSRGKVGSRLFFSPDHSKFVSDFKKTARFDSKTKLEDNFVVLEESKGVKFDFAESLNASVNAAAFRGNFSSEPEKSIAFINKRIAKKTRGKIVKFLSSGSITRNTGLVLINVLYFNAGWKKEFEKKLQPATFKTSHDPENKVETNFMYGEMVVGYLKTEDGTEIISIPFEDENYSMVLVVPQTDLKTFVADDGRSHEILSKVTEPESLEQKTIALWMPKFSVKSKLTLKSALSKKPEYQEFFSKDADYSRMAKAKVEVDEIHQMVVMDVGTTGVEAAAATGITVTLYAAFIPDHEVRVDRPFLHFIVEKPTKMILFGGYVTDPLGSS